MPDRSNVILLHDGSFDGLLSAVFTSYLYHPAPLSIEPQSGVQQRFGIDYRPVETNDEQAQRAAEGIRRRMGQIALERVWNAFASEAPHSSAAVYRYIRLGMRVGPAIGCALTDKRVDAVNALALRLSNEVTRLIEFIRFSRLEGGVYYAAIEPRGMVLPNLMPHFAARYAVQPFLIHDRTHQLAGVFDTREWGIVDASAMQLPGLAEGEADWQRMWKAFYESVSIKERQNLRLQQQHVPLRYRGCMTEMLPDEALGRPLPGHAEKPKPLWLEV